MDQKKTCDICNRLYKIPPLEYPLLIQKTSHVHIKLYEDNKLTIYNGDICPNCARELIWKIKTMKRNAPKKCDYCEFHRGPLHSEYPRTECRHCIDYSYFQLRKHMTKIDRMRWDHFNGDLDVHLKGE